MSSGKPSGLARTAVPRWRVFGSVLETRFRFANPLVCADEAPADLRFVCRDATLDQRPRAGPLYSSPYRTDDGDSVLHLFREEGRDVLSFPGLGEFVLDGGTIMCERRRGVADELVEIRLLGPVLSFWLETRRARLALHASAVGGGGLVGGVRVRQSWREELAGGGARARRPCPRQRRHSRRGGLGGRFRRAPRLSRDAAVARAGDALPRGRRRPSARSSAG